MSCMEQAEIYNLPQNSPRISAKMSASEEIGSGSEPPGSPDIIPGYATASDFTKHGFKVLMDGIKHANSLPAGRDWNFYTAFESFSDAMKEESNKLIADMTAVLKKNEVGANMRNQTLDRKTEILIDVNDLILERVATNIDEMNGIKKTVNQPVVLQTVSAQLPANVNGSWNRSSSLSFSVSQGMVSKGNNETTIRLLTAKNIGKPQISFKDKIDNSNDNPWEPRLKDKPNSLKPLATFLEETDLGREFSHPYEFELDRFTPSEEFLTTIKEVVPLQVAETPLVEVNSVNQLPELVEELRKHKIIAIDLEHHSYRSFMGITCLMQISTVEKDYLIDTLALRNDLWVLNEVFTKPDIVKVFHGADSDILWLQRDLSLYIVNMFDTHFAAKQLEYSGLSLAYLLNRFCSFMPNKQFQLADWRIRPLPDELKNYAREDTHYLIYIYQRMRNELLEKANGRANLLKAVMDNSTNLCKKRYFKPYWHETAHLEFYSRCRRVFDNRQMFALKEIYRWRDQIARIEDESFGYVLPNNMLLEIAERLPKEMEGILACCRPVPPLVRANLLELHEIILKALEKPFDEPILKEDTRARGSTKTIAKINVDSPLYCPHDLSKNEFKDNLPTILTTNNDHIKRILEGPIEVERTEPACSIFKMNQTESFGVAQEKLRQFRSKNSFLGPYDRYQLIRPFIEAREKKLAEEKVRKEEEEKAKVNQTDGDGRTNEERIESVRQHFLHLSRQTLPVQEPESEGKKRKRSESTENPVDQPEVPEPNLRPESSHLNNETPEVRRKNRKRKATEAGTDQSNKTSRRERNKLRMQKRKQKKATAILNNSNVTVSQQNPNRPSETLRGGKRPFKGGPNRGKRHETVKQPEDFNAYDYSMVDFRQFQGGAQSAQKQQQFKAKFRGRGKPNKRGGRGQHNKAMSFGRGRGR